MFQHPHYVMVMVTDMQRSVAFYRDVLGLTLRFESPGWSEFSTGPTTLVLHGWGDPEPVPHLTELPARPTAGTCSFGLMSATCAAFAELVARRPVEQHRGPSGLSGQSSCFRRLLERVFQRPGQGLGQSSYSRTFSAGRPSRSTRPGSTRISC